MVRDSGRSIMLHVQLNRYKYTECKCAFLHNGNVESIKINLPFICQLDKVTACDLKINTLRVCQTDFACIKSVERTSLSLDLFNNSNHFLNIINLKLIVCLAFESRSRLQHMVEIFFVSVVVYSIEWMRFGSSTLSHSQQSSHTVNTL